MMKSHPDIGTNLGGRSRARVKNHSDATGEQTGQVEVIIDDVKTGSAK